MSYSAAHIICAFQTSKPCWLMGETRLWWSWFDRRVQLQTWHFLWVADFDRNFWVMKTSMKRMSVGKSGPTTAPVASQSKHLTTRLLICAQMVAQKQLCSPFCYVLSRRFPKNCSLGKALQRCAWHHLNCTWKFHIIIGRSVSTRGRAKSSMTKWFLQLPPEYNLTATIIKNSVD